MAVKVEIRAANFEPSPELREHIESRVAKLDRYLDILETAQMDLVHARSARSAQDRHVAQLTVRGKGVLLRAEERTQDIYASVDAVLDKVHRQIERFKGRRWDHRGDGRSASDVAPEPAPKAEAAAPQAVARRKKLALTPMDEREAIDQMALLSHEDFFVYLDSASNTVHVLYRRRDGSLGLIETEVA